MNNEKQYGVLHEIGDYYQPKELNSDDNRKLNEQLNHKEENKQDNKNE